MTQKKSYPATRTMFYDAVHHSREDQETMCQAGTVSALEHVLFYFEECLLALQGDN